MVEIRDALAMMDARTEDAIPGSMEDWERISFMSYLKGASLWVFSMDCLWVAALLGFPEELFFLFCALGREGAFWEDPL